jgi:coenzyme F420-0:L-glutamate ligase / coenzyme F420-1:gamma-L-glutamate ligase
VDESWWTLIANAGPVTIWPLPNIGEVNRGDNIGAILGRTLRQLEVAMSSQHVIVVAQKIVSKAEGRRVFLDEIQPSSRALELAAITGKDAALVELVLQESVAVLRALPNVLIVRHRLGYVVANAGIDQSNVGGIAGRPACLLLPLDPAASAASIRAELHAHVGCTPAVIVSDSFGRPWRRGVVNVALGSAGLNSLVNLRGKADRHGRPLYVTEVALADALAAAAGLIMGEADEGTPAVVIAGVEWPGPDLEASALIRPLEEDLFQ